MQEVLNVNHTNIFWLDEFVRSEMLSFRVTTIWNAKFSFGTPCSSTFILQQQIDEIDSFLIALASAIKQGLRHYTKTFLNFHLELFCSLIKMKLIFNKCDICAMFQCYNIPIFNFVKHMNITNTDLGSLIGIFDYGFPKVWKFSNFPATLILL